MTDLPTPADSNSSRLRAIYRSYGGDNRKCRPEFYSKRLALLSFIRAVRALKPGQAELIFLNDGPIQPDVLALMTQAGEVVNRPHSELRASERPELSLPSERGWPATDLIWFAEYDYLYRSDALVGLISAADAFPSATYSALYGLKRRVRRAGVSVVRLALNGYQMARRWLGRPTRLMEAPDPVLISHLESAELSLGTDWEALAGETLRWAQAVDSPRRQAAAASPA